MLRNLEVIESVNLEFDKNRIQADTKTIYWDEVLSASAPNDQAQFDQHLREIGTPLFRFCHRLKIKDYGSLPTTAEAWFADIRNINPSTDNCHNQFVIAAACYYGRIANGQREKAIVPLQRIFELLDTFSQLDSLADKFAMNSMDRINHFANNLVPIWFNKPTAQNVLQELNQTFNQQSLKQLKPGQLVYYATLATTSSDNDPAPILAELSSRKTKFTNTWYLIIRTLQGSKQHADLLAGQYTSWKGAPRAAANYALATTHFSKKNNPDKAVLGLLYIPANFSDQFPHIAAAAIYQAANLLKDAQRTDEAEILRSKLFEEFKSSYHGKQEIERGQQTRK